MSVRLFVFLCGLLAFSGCYMIIVIRGWFVSTADTAVGKRADLVSMPMHVLYYSPHEEVSHALQQAIGSGNDDDNKVIDLAITARSHFIIRQEGWTYYHIPSGLHDFMTPPTMSNKRPTPIHVALGPEHQYVALFPDGKFQMSGPR